MVASDAIKLSVMGSNHKPRRPSGVNGDQATSQVNGITGNGEFGPILQQN